jgi:hypothetical protein
MLSFKLYYLIFMNDLHVFCINGTFTKFISYILLYVFIIVNKFERSKNR